MRVLMLGKGWFPDELGGLDRFYRGLFEGLLEEGKSVEGVVIGPAAAPPEGLHAVSSHDAPILARIARITVTGLRVRRDLVNVHFAIYGLPTVLLARLRGKPVVAHFHGPWADETRSARNSGALGHRVRHGIERAVYRRAERLVVLSHAFKQTLVEEYGIEPWRIHVIWPGVDTRHFTVGDRAESRRRLGIAEDEFVVVALRRLVPRMGLDVLIDALAGLAASDQAAPLAVIAGDGPERARLEERAREAGLGARVRFLGRLDDDDVVHLYRAADVNVVPTAAYEGFGLIALEAAACGTPTLVTDVGGLPEVAAGLGTDLVVPAEDSEALAQSLSRLMHEPDRRPDPAALRRVAERSSWRRAARETAEVFARAADKRREPRRRVVYIDHVARLSGGELALLRLLPNLRDDVDAHVILAEDGPFATQLRSAGVSVEVLPLGPHARELRKGGVGIGVDTLRAGITTARYTVRLARRLRRLRPDLVHTNSLKSGVYGTFAARLAGVPSVWHVRDRVAGDYLSPLGVTMVRFLTRRIPDAVIVNSKATEQTLDTAARANVVPSVVPEVIAQPPTWPQQRRREDGLRVGMVGRLTEWKGQHVFLEAFSQAFPNGEVHGCLIGAPLFGEEARYEAALRDQAARLEITDRVEFRGHRDDVWDELSRLDILVHASILPEPFGQVVIEGLAAGVPVIATQEGGPGEIIEDGVSGLTVPAGNAHALADALRRLAADEDLRGRLAEGGKAKAQEFGPDRVTREITRVYDGVLGHRG